jgi:parallel beta-helix repeat protein
LKSFQRVVGVVTATVLAGVPLVVVSATPASAEPCGLTVSSSYTLTSDVTGCTGIAITVTGNNLVLDLNGRTVSCRPGIAGDGPGIYVPDRTGVTIRNGTVRYCDNGIYLEEGGGHTITNVTAIDNIGGLTGGGIFGEGIQLYGSNDNRIINNRVIHNGTFAGIDLFDSNRNLIEGNLVQDNNIIQVNAQGQPRVMQDIGIWIIFIGDFASASNNIVRGNNVLRNGLDGIQLGTASTDNTAEANTVAGNGFGQRPGILYGFGIAISGQRQLVQSNQVLNNGGHGINVAVNSRNHRILNNRASGNGQAPSAAPQFDLNDLNFNPPCDNNLWRSNTGTRNQTDRKSVV